MTHEQDYYLIIHIYICLLVSKFCHMAERFLLILAENFGLQELCYIQSPMHFKIPLYYAKKGTLKIHRCGWNWHTRLTSAALFFQWNKTWQKHCSHAFIWTLSLNNVYGTTWQHYPKHYSSLMPCMQSKSGQHIMYRINFSMEKPDLYVWVNATRMERWGAFSNCKRSITTNYKE